MKKYFLLFVLSVVIYFAHSVATSQGLYGDGNGYYVYTQSLLFDHKLNSPKVYEFLSNFKGPKYIFSRIFWSPERNPYTIGTAVVWLPSLAITSLFTTDRFNLINELGPGLTGIILMVAGLYFLEKYLLNFYARDSVFWTILTIFFATSVFYYSAFEPALSHQPSFFLICFLLWWTYSRSKTNTNIFLFGLLTGLLGMIRMVDVLLLIPIIWQFKPKLKDLPLILSGFMIAISPQLLNQYSTYKTIFMNPYFTPANGHWSFNLIHSFDYLFSPQRGLFLWSPILLIGLWGLIKSKSTIFIITVVFLWLVTSSWSAYLSAGFGQRLAFSTIPFFVYGLAYVFERLNLKKIVTIFLIFSLWNFLLLKNVYLHKDIFIQKSDFKFSEFGKYMVLLH